MKGALTVAKNKIAQTNFEAKSKASNNGKRLGDGWLQKVVDDVKERRGINEISRISPCHGKNQKMPDCLRNTWVGQ